MPRQLPGVEGLKESSFPFLYFSSFNISFLLLRCCDHWHFWKSHRLLESRDTWCSLDLSPWLWCQFFRAPNSQSGWIKKSAINGCSFELPLLLLQQKRHSSSTGIAIACFNEPWQPRGEDPGASQLWVCHLPRLRQKSRCLLTSRGKVASGGVCFWGKMKL